MADGLTILGDGTGGDPFRVDTTLLATRTYADSLFSVADSLREAGDRSTPILIQAFDRIIQLDGCSTSETVITGFQLIDDTAIDEGAITFEIGSPQSITYDVYNADSTSYYFETSVSRAAGIYTWEVGYTDPDGNFVGDTNLFEVMAGTPDTVTVWLNDSISVTRRCGVEISRDTIIPADNVAGTGTTNRTALWTAANTIGDSYLLQSASALTLDANKMFTLTGGTTASRPTATAGGHWYNTTVLRPQWSDGVSWYEYSPWTRTANGITYTNATGTVTIDNTTFLYNTTGSTTNTHLGTNANYGHTSTSSTFIGSGAGSGNNNTRITAIGASAGNGSSGQWQTFVGVNAGLSTAQSESVYIGTNCGLSNTGAKPVIIGVTAGVSNTGANPTFIGYEAGQSNTGSNSTLMGHRTGKSNTGHFLTAFGANAGGSNTAANTTLAGYNAGVNNIGADLTSVGYNASVSNKGQGVTAIGSQSGYLAVGEKTTAVGYKALYGNSTDSLVAIGYEAGSFQADPSKRDTFYMVDKSGNQVKIWGSTAKWGGIGDIVVLEAVQGLSNFAPNRIAQWQINTDSTLTCQEATSGTLDSNIVTLSLGLNFSNTTAIGFQARADKSNQIAVGNENVTEIKLGPGRLRSDNFDIAQDGWIYEYSEAEEALILTENQVLTRQNAIYYEDEEREYTLATTGADTIITVDTMSLAIGTDSISLDAGLIENLKSDTVRWQVSYDFFYDSDEDACYSLIDLTTDGTEVPDAIPGSAARAEQVSPFGAQMPGRTFHVDVPPGQKIRLCVKGNVGSAIQMNISYLTVSINEINR